jgi:hypothetical protein
VDIQHLRLGTSYGATKECPAPKLLAMLDNGCSMPDNGWEVSGRAVRELPAHGARGVVVPVD